MLCTAIPTPQLHIVAAPEKSETVGGLDTVSRPLTHQQHLVRPLADPLQLCFDRQCSGIGSNYSSALNIIVILDIALL